MLAEQLFLKAVNAALTASEKILKIYKSDFLSELKADNSPVTEADHASQEIIVEMLSSTEIPVISEEAEAPAYEIRKGWNLCWLVDPLDGTKEFIKRNGEFTVNIALIDKGKPVMGIVGAPAKQVLYAGCSQLNIALKLTGLHQPFSSFNDLKNASRELIPETGDVYAIAVSRSHLNQRTIDYLNQKNSIYPVIETVPAGSSLKFMLLAEGKVNEYPRFGPTMEWDSAAAHAILKVVGKNVRDLNGAELIYNKQDLRNPQFIAL